MTLEQFRAKVERHLSRNNIAAATFGKEVLNDSGWVLRLRNGLEPKERTRAKVLEAMAAK